MGSDRQTRTVPALRHRTPRRPQLHHRVHPVHNRRLDPLHRETSRQTRQRKIKILIRFCHRVRLDARRKRGMACNITRPEDDIPMMKPSTARGVEKVEIITRITRSSGLRHQPPHNTAGISRRLTAQPGRNRPSDTIQTISLRIHRVVHLQRNHPVVVGDLQRNGRNHMIRRCPREPDRLMILRHRIRNRRNRHIRRPGHGPIRDGNRNRRLIDRVIIPCIRRTPQRAHRNRHLQIAARRSRSHFGRHPHRLRPAVLAHRRQRRWRSPCVRQRQHHFRTRIHNRQHVARNRYIL